MKLGVGQRALAIAAFGLFTTAPAVADTASEIRALKERLQALEAQVAKQKTEVKRATNVANAATAAVTKGPLGPPPPPPVFVSFNNGLFVETADKAYSFKIGGRLFIDGGGISNPIGVPNNFGYKGFAGVRRARFEFEGTAAKIWFYRLEYDFAGSTGSGNALGGIRDAYLGLNVPGSETPYSKGPVWIQVGYMKEPFSLDFINSAKYTDFIERPLSVDAFAPARHLGVAAAARGDAWTAKAGVFSTSFEDNINNPALISAPATFWAPVPRGGGQYFELTGRLTYAPIKTEHELLHLGVAGRYHQPNDATGASDDRMLRVGNRLRSEANVLGMQTLGTPDLSCSTITFPGAFPLANLTTTGLTGKCVTSEFQYGFELAGAWGPLSMQAEYIGMQVNRDSNKMLQAALIGNFFPSAATPFGFTPGGSSAFFNGFYAYGQWYITGEERAAAYSVKGKNGASFEQVKILNPLSKGGFGAVSLAARYSAINLNSGRWSGSGLFNMLTYSTLIVPNTATTALIANQAGIAGGRQENTTLGVNWYPDNGFHFQANWTHVLHWSAPLGAGSAGAFATTGFAGLVPPGLTALQGRYQSAAHPDLFEVRAMVYW
ncbi:porin [Methylocystis sp. B8]|uniref:OprO/OprP family phosphate-selective porin n=1 Tax=Methylocystis sp. B8 TaxID=544938 RepID=UPI0010FE4573|nr:porin [Methylocystis sp. B8]TLG77576.1 carbohydrate porin [Methylocystis sp. B8]